MFNKNRIVTKSECNIEMAASILMVVLGFWFMLSAAGGEWMGWETLGMKHRNAELEGPSRWIIMIIGIVWVILSLPLGQRVTACLRYMDIHAVGSCKIADALEEFTKTRNGTRTPPAGTSGGASSGSIPSGYTWKPTGGTTKPPTSGGTTRTPPSGGTTWAPPSGGSSTKTPTGGGPAAPVGGTWTPPTGSVSGGAASGAAGSAGTASGGTYNQFTCPACKQKVRVPSGQGMIELTCPRCGKIFTVFDY